MRTEFITWIKEILKNRNIPEDIVYKYSETHRYYHNLDHILDMIKSAYEKKILTNSLLLAIIFHDIIYNPKRKNNEELSAELFYQYIKDDEIKQAILDTKTHKPTNELARQLIELDLEVLYKDFKTFKDYEDKIFKEYQFVDFKTYKEKRIGILKSFNVNPEWINYVRYREPKIGVYAGSFNPFHVGHLNILEKAEKIFDKVIIARGKNPEKKGLLSPLPLTIQNRQIAFYDGLLTDYLNSIKYDVTLIRGLRNITDLQAELTQYRFLQDLDPEIKVVSIFCDNEFEYISSSAIRLLSKYEKENKYLIK